MWNSEIISDKFQEYESVLVEIMYKDESPNCIIINL